MPTAKGKGGSAAHRYRPAAQYDDATLAQKREYWRTKKREQRARLSERRKKPTQDFQKKAFCPNSPSVVNTRLSGSLADVSSPLLNKDDSYKTAKVSPAPQSENASGDNAVEDNESQKERWLETIKLDVLPQLPPSSCPISPNAAGGGTATIKCFTRGAVSRTITSPVLSRTQPKTSSSVPPARVTRITNGSSAKTTPQPCVSMQGGSVPKTQHMTQVAFCIQPKLSPTNVNTGMILAPSSCATVSIKAEGKVASTTPQSGTKSALVTSQRAKGVHNSQPPRETEEEKAAKRREHWRIKKREQRAKMAARLAKARERTQGSEVTFQRQAAQKTGHVGCTNRQHLPSQPFLRGVGQKQCPPRHDEQQIGAAGLAPVNLLAEQVKLKNPSGKSTTQTVISSDAISAKKPEESHRKPPSYVHLSNVTRGIARCKTPRQKFIEAQKNLMNQRNLRCKTPLLTSVFGTRNIPKIDPNDTPEQIIAKRREYWRIKKREQRAKLSMEVKTRLKEKDSLMRRVKRYQKILEEMRRARALTQTAGSALTHASEAIGGFIKEDGTVTINVPQVPTYLNTAAHKSGEDRHVAASKNSAITKPQHQPDTKQKSMASVCVNRPPQPPLRLPQVKVSVPLSKQLVNKPPKLLSIRPMTQLESTTASKSNSLAIQAIGQLTLTRPRTTQNGGSAAAAAAASNPGGCVMKMAVSNPLPSVLSLDPELSEDEKMAKKREYWRIKKREQRAARAARLKQGLLQARVSAALQRRKAQKQVAVTTVLAGRRLANQTRHAPLANNSVSIMPHASEIKQESESVPADDLNSQPEKAICPDIKPPTSPTPPTPPQADPDPALNADSQATTLLAVASMKKLLEESLSTVRECKSEQSDVKIESVEEASDSELRLEKDEAAPIAADLMLEIKSWQADTDVLVQAGSTSPLLKDAQHNNVTVAPLPSSNEVVPHAVCEHSSQTPANFIVDPTETSVGLSSLDRLSTEIAGRQNCCSPELPKLHHPPMDQHCEQQCQAEEQCPIVNSPSAQRYCSVATEHSGLTSLQRKREYWKLMKRQQRARLKARQTERRGECSSQLPKRNTQVM